MATIMERNVQKGNKEMSKEYDHFWKLHAVNLIKTFEEENTRLEAEIERLKAWIEYYGLMEKVNQGGKP